MKNPKDLTTRTMMVTNRHDAAAFRRQVPAQIRQKQGGFSLLGYGLAAILVLGVAIGLINTFNDNSERNAERNAHSNLASLRAGIAEKVGNNGNFGDLDTDGDTLLIDLGVVPSSLVQGDAVRNEFNGFYTFGSSNGGVTTAPDDAYAFINTDEIPRAMCMDFAQRDNGWQRLEVNGAEVDYSASDAQTNCEDDGNELTFTFRR